MANSAPNQRASSRLFRALAAGIASSCLILSGCDSPTNKTDQTVSQQLDEASLQMDGVASDRMSAHQAIESASKDTGTSLPVQIRAKAMLADSELRIAQSISLQIQKNDVAIDRLAREIGLLGGNIEADNIRAAALAKYEPSALQAAVAQKQADVKGSDDKPDWYKSADAALPSLSADDKQAADIQTQISQLQDTIKSETDQRNQLIEQADKLTEQSYHEQKEKSVDLYIQGSNARKQAADLTVKLNQDNVTLTRAQADLAVRNGQHESLTATIKAFDDKSAFFAKDWTDVQAMIAQLNDQSKKYLGDDPVDVPKKDAKTGEIAADNKTDNTIAWKSAAIAVLAAENHNLRAEAEPHFNSAKSFYQTAGELAQKLLVDIKDKEAKKADPESNPDALAWDVEKDALDPSSYRFLEADVDMQKASFLTQAAAEDKVRLDLLERMKPLLTAAQLTVPPKLDDADGSIALQMKNSLTSADESYKNATELLSSISEGIGAPEQKSAAQVQLIFAQYGWASLLAAQGDAQKSAEHINYARNAVAAATTDGATLPSLPAELMEPAAGGTTPGAPSSTPGTAPGSTRLPAR
jgi:hypothetical protein